MVLDVKDLRYHLPANGRPLVDGISFAVGAGETLVLLGRSGSGKTTTLKLVNRLLTPTGGPCRSRARPERRPVRIALRRRIGYVIQDVGLFPHFSVAANVGLLPRLEQWPADRIERRVRELLALVGLDPDTFAARFRISSPAVSASASASLAPLALDPPLLLLDEPFGALDPITRLELQREFRALEGTLGKAMVLVTHDVREGAVARHAHRAARRRTAGVSRNAGRVSRQHAARGP